MINLGVAPDLLDPCRCSGSAPALMIVEKNQFVVIRESACENELKELSLCSQSLLC